ncbi:permease [Aliamphritea hakodatensis]|uniref:permease n=1 Tax=Aliamphritea hakodatensis TaxID=2895352 RepID=UPI0022FD49EB|nr:permease [Aliamphritea hakodatensis]
MFCSTSGTADSAGGRNISYWRWLVSGLLLVAIAMSPAAFGRAVLFTLDSLWLVSPMIVIGLVLTALMLASNSMQLIARAFHGRELPMILWVSMVGAVTPVCGATVLPLIAGLLIARVPLAPVMAFWLASPITDPAMLSLTAATLGWPLALAKTAGSVGAGVFGGLAVLLLTTNGYLKDPVRSGSQLQRFSCDTADAGGAIVWRFWKIPSRKAVFVGSIKSNGRLMLIWLSLAFIAEFYLQTYVPLDWLPGLLGAEAAWAVPLAAIVGAPIYLDGYAALPLVRGLIDAGMGYDAALTFLVAGGITSAWAAVPVFALVRGRVFLFYLLLALLASVLVGFIGGLFL